MMITILIVMIVIIIIIITIDYVIWSLEPYPRTPLP